MSNLNTIHFQCYKYRKMFDQVARNRMREKLTASLIFKNRKILYALRYFNYNLFNIIQYLRRNSKLMWVLCVASFSVPHPFLGDYVRLRQNAQWKKLCVTSNDQYIVFADIINKITRSTGKVGVLTHIFTRKLNYFHFTFRLYRF